MNDFYASLSQCHKNRRIWAIIDLLNGPLRQKDILDLWRQRAEFLYSHLDSSVSQDERLKYKPKEFRDGMGITPSSLSKIIHGSTNSKRKPGLIEDGIVEQKFINNKKSVCALIGSYEVLYNILDELERNKADKYLMDHFRASQYFNNLVNLDLVKEYGDIQDKDKQNLILFFIKISHTALLEFLKEIVDKKTLKTRYENIHPRDVLRLYGIYHLNPHNAETAKKIAFKPLTIWYAFRCGFLLCVSIS